MPSYWIDFTNKPSGCVHASSPEEAKTIATEARFGAQADADGRPYGTY